MKTWLCALIYLDVPQKMVRVKIAKNVNVEHLDVVQNLWCMAEYDFCALGPECAIKNGAEQNNAPCRCGPNTNCVGDKLGCEPEWPTADGPKARCFACKLSNRRWFIAE